MAVTRNDVARLAGVSTATVSYVVNNGPRPVSPKTRAKVLRAIEQLNYHPSALARSLKTNRTQAVGIIVSDILNHILAGIAKAAEDLLLPSGYSLMVCNSDESAERERLWLESLRSRRADGILLLPTGTANLRLLFSILEMGSRVVLIDRQLEGLDVDAVFFDNEQGAYDAVHHLTDLGHRRIGLIGLPSNLTPGRRRLAGYMRALQMADILADPDLIKEGTFTAEDGYTLTGQLLDRQPPPTALFVASNRLSRGTLLQIKERGLRMPDDVALCVFDDVPHFSYMTPSISAAAYDVQAFAEKAVDFLCQRMNGEYKGEGRTAYIPCQLQARESTLGLQG